MLKIKLTLYIMYFFFGFTSLRWHLERKWLKKSTYAMLALPPAEAGNPQYVNLMYMCTNEIIISKFCNVFLIVQVFLNVDRGTILSPLNFMG